MEIELRTLLTQDWDILLNVDFTDATGYPDGLAIPGTPTTAAAILHYEHDLAGSLSVFGSLKCDYAGTRTDAPYGETITLWKYGNLLAHLPSYNLDPKSRQRKKADRDIAATERSGYGSA